MWLRVRAVNPRLVEVLRPQLELAKELQRQGVYARWVGYLRGHAVLLGVLGNSFPFRLRPFRLLDSLTDSQS